MASIFSKIISGEIPCFKIAENNSCFAFLDINPLVEGHVLVVPKIEVDYIFDIDSNLLSELHVFSQVIAKAIKKTIPCKRVGVAIIGLEVPHAHIHLIPLNKMDDINFTRQKLNPTSEELKNTANKIIKALAI